MRRLGEDNITLDEQMILGIEVMVSIETEPQIKAPRVAPLEGASTYAPAGAYVSMHCGGHDADERRLITSAHCKGHKNRKAQQQSLHYYIDKHPRNRTRMARIRRIFTDTLIQKDLE